ncbi:hypothetical protein YC2023_074372 [Brassica napus]
MSLRISLTSLFFAVPKNKHTKLNEEWRDMLHRMARTKIGVRPLREKEKEDKLMLLYIKPVTVLDILQYFETHCTISIVIKSPRPRGRPTCKKGGAMDTVEHDPGKKISWVRHCLDHNAHEEAAEGAQRQQRRPLNTQEEAAAAAGLRVLVSSAASSCAFRGRRFCRFKKLNP